MPPILGFYYVSAILIRKKFYLYIFVLQIASKLNALEKQQSVISQLCGLAKLLFCIMWY